MKRILIWTAIAFILITLVTMENNAASDGLSAYGFPIRFYSYTGAKADPSTPDHFGFKPISLLIDISYTSIIGCFARLVSRTFRKTGS